MSLHPQGHASKQRSDERSVMLHVGALLHSLTARWNGVSVAGVAAMHNEIAMDAPEISMRDACDLTTMISQVVSNARRDPEELRAVLFEAHPQLMAILLSFLQAPQSAVPDDAVADFLVALFNTLTDVVCAACQEGSSPQGLDGDSELTNTNDGSWAYIRNLMTHALRSHETVPMIVAMLSPMLPEHVQQSAAEFLFALLARVDEARIAATQPSCFETLYSSLSEQQSPTLRAFVAACIRELANTQSDVFWQNQALMETLIRLMPLDEAPDVRALAAETLETVFLHITSSNHGTSAIAQFNRLRELSAAVVDRLESEDVVECQIAVLKLTETLLDLEKESSVPDRDRMHGKSSSSTSSSFSEYLLSSYAERIFVQHLQPNSRVGSLASRCLRLLIQVAPFYRFAAFGLVQHFPSLSKILKLCVTLASDVAGNREVVSQVVRVEASIAITLCLAQDPRCRQLLDSQLTEHPHYMAQLRSALLSNLNSAALDYFEDVQIVDAVGDLLTWEGAVQWENFSASSPFATTAARPTKESVTAVFDNQEGRWASSPVPGDVTHPQGGVVNAPGFMKQQLHHHASRPTSDLERGKLQRLVFILLTYVAHRTLGQSHHPQASSNVFGGSHTGLESPVVEVSPISAGGGASMPPPPAADAAGPVPTRASMLREWGSHPHKAGAVMRAAETIREGGTIGGTSSNATYVQDSFAAGAAPSTSSQPPHPSSRVLLTPAKMVRRPSPQRQQSHHRGSTFSKFDHALKLAMQFAQYFRGSGGDRPAHKVALYETSGDGFARRVPSSQIGGGDPSRRYVDPAASLAPGALPPPSSSQQRSWSVDQLKEGDLFFFSLPLLEVTQHSLEQVRARAIRHLNVIKKSFVVTPQVAKSRRWFLFDMATHVLPGIIHATSQLIELFVLHGDEAAKFPMVLFREQALRDDPQQSNREDQIASSSELHAGNLLEVLDQVRFYFSNVSKANPTVAEGSPRRSTYLADLESKIAILSAQKFDGREGSTSAAAAGMDGEYRDAAHSGRRAEASPSLRIPRSFQYDSDDDDV